MLIFAGGFFASANFSLSEKSNSPVLTSPSSLDFKKKVVLPIPIDPAGKDVYYTNSCFNDSTHFFAVSDEDVDSVEWRFEGFGTFYSNKRDTSFVFPAAGEYPLTVTYFKGDESVSLAQKTVVIGEDVEPDLGKDTVLCPQDVYTLNPFQNGTPPAGSVIVWNDGSTGNTLQIPADSAGIYWVSVTTPSGCSAIDEVEITRYGEGTNRASFWYFGNQAGIDFNKQPPTAKTDGQITAPEGSATISDINGKLLFYTDGNVIYNKKHEPMVNNTLKNPDIGGDNTSSQSSIIAPWPGNPNKYFVFTTDEMDADGSTLNHSLVDMSKDTGKGEVVFSNNFLDQPVTEQLTAYGSDTVYWLVTHELGNNNFNVYRVDSSGVNVPPKTYSFGSTLDNSNSEGYMKISSTGNYLAVAVGDKVELYNFDADSGIISDPVEIDLGDDADQAYGIDFSPDGSKLYVSKNDSLLQIDIDSLGERMPDDKIKADYHKSVIASGSKFGAIQIGPDNLLYVAVNGASHLGVINNPDSDEARPGVPGASFSLEGIDLQGKTSSLGLPNFVQSFIEPPPGPGIGTNDVCYPEAASIFGSGWGDRDFFVYNFGDGSPVQSGKNLTQVQHSYPDPGDVMKKYTVTLTVTNGCTNKDTTMTAEIRVVKMPKNISFSNPIVICDGESVTLPDTEVMEDGVTYLWSNGSTGRATFSQPGLYQLIAVRDSSECYVTATANIIRPAFAQITTADSTLCSGETTVLDAGSYQNATYKWTGPNVSGSSATQRRITVSAAGTYAVTVSLAGNNCSSSDDIIVTVNPAPSVNFTEVKPSCNDKNGSITAIAGSDPEFSKYTFRWFDSNNNPINTPTPHTIKNLAQGLYKLRVSHPQRCDKEFTHALNPNTTSNPDVAPKNGTTDCVTGTLGVKVTGMTVLTSGSYQFSVYNQQNNRLIKTIPSFSGTESAIVQLSSGTYYVSGKDPNGCIYNVPDILVQSNVSTPSPFDLDESVTICDNTYTISVETDASDVNAVNYAYKWSGDGGTFNTATDLKTVTVGKNSANENKAYNFFLAVTNTANGCVKFDTITVNFSETFEVTLAEIPDYCDDNLPFQITPTFNPEVSPGVSKRYLYQWEKIGSTVNIPSSPSLVINNSTQNGQYKVTVTNPQTGCSKTSNTVNVNVVPSPVDNLPPFITNNCSGENIFLDAGNQGAEFVWSGPSVKDEEKNQSLIEVSKSGKYIVRISRNGCSRTDSVDVVVGKGPESGLTVDSLKFCTNNGGSASVVAGRDIAELAYSWTKYPSSKVVATKNKLITSEAGIYIVQITGKNFNCITTDTVTIIAECEDHIFVPNAFSPNGDGDNEIFEFKGQPVKYFEVTIFNRWGQLIYQSNNKEAGWNGTTSVGGKPAPSGTYVYIIKYKSLKGDQDKMYTKKGTLVLVK